MKYDHAVIYEGKFYEAGSDVPSGKKEADAEKKVSAPVLEEPVVEKKRAGRPPKKDEE